MCQCTSSTCSCSRTYNDTVWTYWSTGTSTTTVTISSATNYNDIVWGHWNSTGTVADQVTTLKLRASEIAAREERLRIRREEEAAAKAKAEQLLLEHLDENQKEEYRNVRAFKVVSADGQRVYKIREGWAGNVDLVSPEGKVLKRYCIHPDIACPVQDNMLAQKLLLETDEQAFIRIANASDPITGRRVA